MGSPARQASHQPPQPSDDFLEAERLRDVVIPARRQPGDAILDGVLRGQEQDRHVVAIGSYPPEHLQTADVRQHDVQHHRVRTEDPRLAHGLVSCRCSPDGPTLVAQRHLQQLGQHRFIVDHEHPQRCAVEPPQLP